MAPQDIKNKIESLNQWLANNVNNPNYCDVLKDKQELQKQLKELEDAG